MNVFKITPVKFLVDQLKAKNPNLTSMSEAAFIPYKIAELTNDPSGKNTKVTIYGNSTLGIEGAMDIKIDRIDLNKQFNQFGAVTKKPSVLVFGTAGAATTLAANLDQINAKLGTEFSLTGSHPDLNPVSFNYPAKGAIVDVAVTGYQNAAPERPFSLRAKPGSVLNLSFVNKGSKVADVLTTRVARPLVRADNNLNWTIVDAMPLSAPKIHPGLVLRNLDFSSVFALPGEELFKEMRGKLPGSDGGYWGEFYFQFTDKEKAMLNILLNSAGLPNVSVSYTTPLSVNGLYYCGRDMGEGSTYSYAKVKEFFQKPIAQSGVAWTDSSKFTHCFNGDQYKLALQLVPSAAVANALVILQFNKL